MNRRRFLTGAVTTGGGALLGGTAVAVGDAGYNPQAILLGILNGERRWNGLAPAVPNPLMQMQAEAQASTLALRQELQHLTAGQFNWWTDTRRDGHLSWCGEIIGYAAAGESNLLTLDHLWVRSPPHRAIMLDPRAALVGVGVREAAGRYWASAFFGG